MNDWITNSKKFYLIEMNLVWRGSRDGFTAAKFHGLCDKIGPTLTLIQSESST